MADHCCPPTQGSPTLNTGRYRKILWAALLINGAMFAVEITAGLHSGSVSLLADAVDFLGDAANYAISLSVLSLGLLWRARAAFVKGLTMGVYGFLVLGKTGWNAIAGIVPDPMTMGIIGSIALVANLCVAAMLYAFRDGDANMRSVWLCTRNDALGNIAVLLATIGVFGTKSAWPDLIVATAMAVLALTAAISIVRQSNREIYQARNS